MEPSEEPQARQSPTVSSRCWILHAHNTRTRIEMHVATPQQFDHDPVVLTLRLSTTGRTLPLQQRLLRLPCERHSSWDQYCASSDQRCHCNRGSILTFGSSRTVHTTFHYLPLYSLGHLPLCPTQSTRQPTLATHKKNTTFEKVNQCEFRDGNPCWWGSV